MAPSDKGALKNFLVKHANVFAWSHKDICGIKTTIIQHNLYVNPESKNIKKKWRTFSRKKNAAITEEVDRLMATNFMLEVQYLKWLPTFFW